MNSTNNIEEQSLLLTIKAIVDKFDNDSNDKKNETLVNSLKTILSERIDNKFRKTYIITTTPKYGGVGGTITRMNGGYGAMELLGVLEFVKSDVIRVINEQVSPDTIFIHYEKRKEISSFQMEQDLNNNKYDRRDKRCW